LIRGGISDTLALMQNRLTRQICRRTWVESVTVQPFTNAHIVALRAPFVFTATGRETQTFQSGKAALSGTIRALVQNALHVYKAAKYHHGKLYVLPATGTDWALVGHFPSRDAAASYAAASYALTLTA